jgi:steroid delta-isomerase-like uncharacterized protein
MGAQENLAVHTAWATAEDRHDLTHHGDFLHDDIVFYLPGSEPVIGIDAYVAMMEALYASLEDFSVVLDDQFATDDRVVCRYRTRGTHNRDLFGVPATGKQIEFAGMSLWEFDQGKARRGWSFSDLPALMAQLHSRPGS